MHTTDAAILDAFDEYQSSIGLASTTIRNRRSILTTLSATLDCPLVEATTRDIRRALMRDDIEPGTRRTYRGAYVAFYSFLVEDEYREDNPTRRVQPVVAPKGTPRPFSREQVDAMLTSGAYRRTRAMILLGYYQGFRVSQIARVHGRDVDQLAGTISTVGKGNKPGLLPLHPVVRELALVMPSDDWWFPARRGRGGHVSSSSVTDLITRAKVRAGITDERLTPHSLRHSFGTHLVDAGTDIRVVQELMMHASLSTTQIYTGVSEQLKRAGIAALPAREIPAHSGRSLQDDLPAAA